MTLADLDEVQYDLEVDGMQVREQLARRIWEARGWATVAVMFRERDKDGDWKSPKVALLRFRRMHDAWQKQAIVTIDAGDAFELADTLGGWRETVSAGS
ncbi:MAG: hypothetical protein HOV81_19240 [Kofleriaceae bacterium]|nr:hypothetical protein [Kofleriaceae bacterium]